MDPSNADSPRFQAAEAAEAYLTAQLVTTPPWRLQETLYDGAIRACVLAVHALDAGDADLAACRLRRARKIVQHLQGALSSCAGGPLGGQLAQMYDQVHRRLIEADFYRKREAVDESIQLLTYRRATLARFVEAIGRGGTIAAPASDAPSWIG